MGHRFSKTAANNIAANKKASANEKVFSPATKTKFIPIPNGKTQQLLCSTINLQIQGSPSSFISTSTNADNSLLQQQHLQYNTNNNNISNSLTSVNNLSCGRQIIIKIQLAKMENGNETATTLSSTSSFSQQAQQQQQLWQDTSVATSPFDCNLNSTELSTTITATGTQFLNLTLNSSSCNNNCNSSMPNTTTNATTTSNPSASSLFRTAGSSLNKYNNYLHSNNGATSGSNINNNNNSIMTTMSSISERPHRFNSLQFNDEIVDQNIGEIVEYCEVLEDHLQQTQTRDPNFNNSQLLIKEVQDNEANVCCRRKSKPLPFNKGSIVSSSYNTGVKNKSRYRKSGCHDAFKRFLGPSHTRSNKNNKQQKEQKRSKSQDKHSINNHIFNDKLQAQRNFMNSTKLITDKTNPTLEKTTSAIVVPPAVSSQVSLWGPGARASGNDVIIPLNSTAPSQFVVVQCAIVNPSNAALHPLSATNAIPNASLIKNPNMLSITAQDLSPTISTSSSSNDLMVKVPSNNFRAAGSSSISVGPIVHSQVDFVHYLVPDLERITNSSFYWGKMDRYEAERLLEGKPEGTFLLRDSAQEEFLFSVTFRKYARSLHARIEQSEHRFSFDCHDPCVFTAPTVTGLLEHYKDPACVMFFEPMLTIPLHRKNCFSLQQLCRATIVSNTSYDGINELELPKILKSYLKEYHYKQKLRVISNEHHYSLHCQ